MSRSPLARLIAPRSIAFIGGREAETAIRVTRQLGFPGTIYAVNPRLDELAGGPVRNSEAQVLDELCAPERTSLLWPLHAQ